MRFRVEGLSKLTRALERTVKRLETATEKAARDAAKLIIQEAVSTVAIDTGALQASGMWYQENSGFDVAIVAGFGFPVAGFYDEYGREKDPSLYAVYHHEGRDPWFEQAIYTVTPAIHFSVQSRLEKALKP